MENLKIKVNSKSESKEAQELLDALGYSKDAFENKSTPCWIAICNGFTYSDYNIGKSVWYTTRPKEITLQELRDMVNPMKEYLEKQADGSYKLVMRGIVGKDGDIEVPEGENVAYKDHDSGAVYFTSIEMGYRDVDVIWQRHVQPEELPFIDDGITDCREAIQEIYKPTDFGASSLNDQYAEIEQVRQSGMKFDSNKPRHSLLPKGAVNSVIDVLEFGAKKYSADNWQEVDNAKERYYNAAMRHIDLWWNGEKLDPETNVHHLAHAATNLFFLMWFDNK